MGRPVDAGYWLRSAPMTNDLSRSRTLFEQDSTLIAVVELSLSSWLWPGLCQGWTAIL